jgi:hypothetical protein
VSLPLRNKHSIVCDIRYTTTGAATFLLIIATLRVPDLFADCVCTTLPYLVWVVPTLLLLKGGEKPLCGTTFNI